MEGHPHAGTPREVRGTGVGWRSAPAPRSKPGRAARRRTSYLLVQGVPCLVDGSCDALSQVLALEAGGHAHILRVGACSTTGGAREQAVCQCLTSSLASGRANILRVGACGVRGSGRRGQASVQGSRALQWKRSHRGGSQAGEQATPAHLQ